MVVKDGGCDSSAAHRRAGRVSVTVAICTWNRSQSLQHTLEGFARIAIPSETDWELLVVNNNCTDRTDEVIRVFQGRLPVRRIFEGRPGLSHARNRAIAEATGNYIIWTDDDVTVCEGWLSAYVDAFRRWPEAAIFGARLSPGSMATRRVGSGGSIQRWPVCTPPVISEPRPLLSRHM